MTTPTNWPNPERPGEPMFPEQDGEHVICTDPEGDGDSVYYWIAEHQVWVEYDHQGPDDALEEYNLIGWTYIGPVLTPTQINEMLAAEREHIKSMVTRACNLGNIITASQRDMIIAGIDSETAIRNLGAAS